MTITHKISDFLFELFPEAEGDRDKLIDLIKRYYTVGPFEPDVEVDEDTVRITIDVERIEADKDRFEKLVSLAENQQYEDAKELAGELIEESPNISEYHRILGQIYSESGDQEEAVNSLIDALKWNPKNEYALLMMGNIYAKYKDDVDTAMKYYNQVLKIKPDDYLALNNIGIKLFEAGKTDEALIYLKKAHNINPDYPNTLFALAMVEADEGNLQSAFDYAIESLKKNEKQDKLYEQAVGFSLELAKKLIDEIDAKSIVKDFINELNVKTDTEIRAQTDDSINTAATIQYAEVHNRDYHLILYKPDKPAVEHLIIHELMHLELTHEARQQGNEKLFTTNQSTKATFLANFKKDADKLKKNGLPEGQVKKILEFMYEGLNSQAFNTPIDLFIEDRIYDRFEHIKPLQFYSLFTIIREGIEANTRPDIIKVTPKKILSSSIIYNLVSSIHFKNLFGVDLIAEHKPKKSELNKAEDLYEEFQEYRRDKTPGEEYDLVQFWAEDLKLDRYFELVDEDQYQQKTADTILDDIEKDPYGLEEADPSKERKMKQFIAEHGDQDTNMAVTMYMADAMQYFEDMPKDNVKKIAFEIAQVGINGIDPKKEGYKIPSIPGSSFSGYKTLAYYYVSWALAIPEMLSKLQMPFDKEYELAKQMINL